MFNLRKFGLAVLLLTMTACATPTPSKDHYELPRARLSSKITNFEPIRVFVKDSRPYVLNGKKKRAFIGLVRMYGAPISVNLRNGETMVRRFAGTVNLILQQAIQDIYAWGIEDSLDFDPHIEQLAGGYRTLLFDVREWKSDSPDFGRTAFYYDVSVEVRDRDGNPLATASSKGKDVVQKIIDIGENHARVIEGLILDDSVLAALNGEQPTASQVTADSPSSEKNVEIKPDPEPSNETCSVAQIVTMTNSGLSKTQIQAACE